MQNLTPRQRVNQRHAREGVIKKWAGVVLVAIIVGLLVGKMINSLRHYGGETAAAMPAAAQCSDFWNDTNPDVCACAQKAKGLPFKAGPGVCEIQQQDGTWVNTP